jgi:hypothetical protein
MMRCYDMMASDSSKRPKDFSVKAGSGQCLFLFP